MEPKFSNEEEIIPPGESKTITIYYSDIYESLENGVYDFKNFGFMYDENEEKIVYPFGGRIEIPFEKDGNDPQISTDLVIVNVTESSDKFIEIEMTNNSGMVMVYGEQYHIEILDSGEWSELTEKEEAFFNLIAYEVLQEESAEWSAEFEWRYGTLPKGKYRLAKDIRFENDMGEECAAQRIYAEFEVE